MRCDKFVIKCVHLCGCLWIHVCLTLSHSLTLSTYTLIINLYSDSEFCLRLFCFSVQFMQMFARVVDASTQPKSDSIRATYNNYKCDRQTTTNCRKKRMKNSTKEETQTKQTHNKFGKVRKKKKKHTREREKKIHKNE